MLQAFSSLSSEMAEQLTEDPDTAQRVIQHHIVRGQFTPLAAVFFSQIQFAVFL